MIEMTYIARTADPPFAARKAMSRMKELHDTHLGAAVGEDRERGASWADIAEALGRSRQAVRQRLDGCGAGPSRPTRLVFVAVACAAVQRVTVAVRPANTHRPCSKPVESIARTQSSSAIALTAIGGVRPLTPSPSTTTR
jgi:hypothetical protein